MIKTPRIAIIAISPDGQKIALKIAKEIPQVTLCTTHREDENTITGAFIPLGSLEDGMKQLFGESDVILFVSAMGICVRTIAPFLKDKYHDPAILCVDTTGRYVVSVASGHIGGANEWVKRIARILGAEAVITTQSDRQGLWALDTLGSQRGWSTEIEGCSMNAAITSFVNKRHVALLLELHNEGTVCLERTHPPHVDLYYRFEDIDQSQYDLLIAVSYKILKGLSIPCLYYRPQLLHLGLGCRYQAKPESVVDYILSDLRSKGYASSAIASINSIELKRDEPILKELSNRLERPCNYYSSECLASIRVPNPSERVAAATGSMSVSEASALYASQGGVLLIEKQKGCLSPNSEFTYSLAVSPKGLPHGHVEIVGAGPGDPELISVRGKHFLERADLILYAGSLVPIELTYYAKEGATVRSSADMNLEEQFALMKEFYDKHALIVRLHTGDPAIFGAIQEQMALFDEAGMSYHITPGISSFLAAAAELRSQFTIPERVQTIILTRGEGRTPMPEREQLHKLASSQSTMCIYLSAALADEVQSELLVHYPPMTPVAVCYKLSWPEQRIYRGHLSELAQIVREHHLTLTTLIVVGDAIDNRAGLSQLYNGDFKHLFRSISDRPRRDHPAHLLKE